MKRAPAYALIVLALAVSAFSILGARQLPVINAPIVQSTSEASASSVVERDSNGDSKAVRWNATTALVSDGGLKAEYKAKTTSYTLLESDYLVAFNATGGAVTGTLPAAASSDGQILNIKKTDTSVNVVTVDGNGAETIDGAASLYLTLQYESLTVQCDASGWHVLEHYIPLTTTTKATTFSVDGTASVYLCTEGSAYTITLPPAANWMGKRLIFKKVDAGAFGAVLDGNASETIDGSATLSLSSTQYTASEILSDGTNWHVISNK